MDEKHGKTPKEDTIRTPDRSELHAATSSLIELIIANTKENPPEGNYFLNVQNEALEKSIQAYTIKQAKYCIDSMNILQPVVEQLTKELSTAIKNPKPEQILLSLSAMVLGTIYEQKNDQLADALVLNLLSTMTFHGETESLRKEMNLYAPIMKQLKTFVEEKKAQQQSSTESPELGAFFDWIWKRQQSRGLL